MFICVEKGEIAINMKTFHGKRRRKLGSLSSQLIIFLFGCSCFLILVIIFLALRQGKVTASAAILYELLIHLSVFD